MREIPLTRGMVALVDDEDYDWLILKKWHANWQRTNFYAVSSDHILMHRLIMKPPKFYQIDHINRKTLDNQKINLRVVGNAENCLNKNKPRSGISYRGMEFAKPWRVRVWTGIYTRRHIGVYRTKEEAQEAFNANADY